MQALEVQRSLVLLDGRNGLASRGGRVLIASNALHHRLKIGVQDRRVCPAERIQAVEILCRGVLDGYASYSNPESPAVCSFQHTHVVLKFVMVVNVVIGR